MTEKARCRMIIYLSLFLVIGCAVACLLRDCPESNDLSAPMPIVAQDTIAPDTIKLATRISVYNPSRSNTSGDTLLTASGSRIDPNNPQRWLAVQKSWLKFFPYGSKVWVSCPDAPYINGEWEVKDTGCASGIDLLISNPIVCRIEFCLNGYVSNKPIPENEPSLKWYIEKYYFDGDLKKDTIWYYN